jgi:hypothetical protein
MHARVGISRSSAISKKHKIGKARGPIDLEPS